VCDKFCKLIMAFGEANIPSEAILACSIRLASEVCKRGVGFAPLVEIGRRLRRPFSISPVALPL
jgi:hypothetical protein